MRPLAYNLPLVGGDSLQNIEVTTHNSAEACLKLACTDAASHAFKASGRTGQRAGCGTARCRHRPAQVVRRRPAPVPLARHPWQSGPRPGTWSDAPAPSAAGSSRRQVRQLDESLRLQLPFSSATGGPHGPAARPNRSAVHCADRVTGHTHAEASGLWRTSERHRSSSTKAQQCVERLNTHKNTRRQTTFESSQHEEGDVAIVFPQIVHLPSSSTDRSLPS